MFLSTFKKNKTKKISFKKILFLSYLTLGLLNKPNVISQPNINQNFNKESKISTTSFITKAINKTGASVVTIDTQKLVQKKRFSRDSRIFIDPYFERFFGLQLPYNNQPQIEQSQGSGFIFEDDLVMTNAHVVNGSDKLIVGLSNGKKYRGNLIGQDSITDIAIIKLQGWRLGNSSWKSLWSRKYSYSRNN